MLHPVKQGDNRLRLTDIHRTKKLVDFVQITIFERLFPSLGLKLMNISHRLWSAPRTYSTLYSFTSGMGLSSTRACLCMAGLSSHMRPATFQRESPYKCFVCGLFVHSLARSVGWKEKKKGEVGNGRRNKEWTYPSTWLKTTSARDARIPPGKRLLHQR